MSFAPLDGLAKLVFGERAVVGVERLGEPSFSKLSDGLAQEFFEPPSVAFSQRSVPGSMRPSNSSCGTTAAAAPGIIDRLKVLSRVTRGGVRGNSDESPGSSVPVGSVSVNDSPHDGQRTLRPTAPRLALRDFPQLGHATVSDIASDPSRPSPISHPAAPGDSSLTLDEPEDLCKEPRQIVGLAR